MAENIKGTNIASPVAPFTTDDAYPTHYAKYGNGGYKEVATTADRDAIPLSRLEEGCVVYVKANNTEYRWIDNAWEESSIDLSEYVKKDEDGNVDITGNLSVGGKLDVEDVLRTEKGDYNSIISLGNNTIGEQDEPDSWEEDGEIVNDYAYATVVLGDNNESHNSVVLGNYNKTQGYTSVIGNHNDLSQGYGWVFGASNKITNDKTNNYIFGNSNECAWSGALMIGNYNKQLSTGSASYYADAGITIGKNNISKGKNSLIIGSYNQEDSTANRIIIANGTSNTKRHNVITVDSDNKVTIDGDLFIVNDGSTVDVKSAISNSGLVPMIYTINTSDCTITSDTTKGVAPYNASYGYTNIEINKNSGIKWVEGAIYIFNLTATIGASATRNGRIRIGGDSDGDTWHPLMNASGSIIACHSYLTKANNYMWTYKTTYQTGGALHMQTDSNTTYDYLINYGYWTTSTACPRYTLCFMTTPFGSTTPTIGALVTTSSTGSSKAVNSGKFYAYDYPYYNSAGTYEAGTTPTMIQGYCNADLRYTANTSNTYVTTNQRVFLHLNDYDPEDKSFTATNAVGSICSLDKLATKFPAGTAGRYVYLYLLGHTTTTWYTLRPEYDMSVGRIYRYDSTEGTLEEFQPADGSLTDLPVETGSGVNSLQQTGNTASGNYSLALGTGIDYDYDENWNEIILPISSEATGVGSVAIGGKATNEGAYAIGSCSSASGMTSIALGAFANAEEGSDTAIGVQSTASGGRAVSIGGSSNASGFNSIAIGSYCKAQQDNSVAIGYTATANRKAQVVLGAYNLADNTKKFIIGDGYYDNSKRKTIYQNVLTIDDNDLLEHRGTIKCNAIQIGNTTINESQLQALLALIS